ncbi:MAG: hypothetical protein IPK16_02215 [Anaerolineales bacterium]|nr:hypothetical protein [Anaerolineales bacterium]
MALFDLLTATSKHHIIANAALSLVTSNVSTGAPYIMPLNTSRPAPQPAIAIFFALYWALFLPFICWGAWATSGHPHARPHLVFEMPEQLAQMAAAHPHAMMHDAVQDLARCVSGVMPTVFGGGQPIGTRLDACEIQSGSVDVAGQSLPSTLASIILILIANPAEHRDVRPVLQRHPAQAHLFPADLALTVPDPPPRIG